LKLTIAYISRRSEETSSIQQLTRLYLDRIGNQFAKISALSYQFNKAFMKSLENQRTSPLLVLLDSRGKQFSSEQFAQWLGKQRDEGRQNIVFAIGPADGWSDETRKRADLLLSLGPMTLPHELARVVLSEQIYRAFTILSGHPYHTGH
jgi:23S rRNA (pseudouridine1915-N3)-methyltransferase